MPATADRIPASGQIAQVSELAMPLLRRRHSAEIDDLPLARDARPRRHRPRGDPAGRRDLHRMSLEGGARQLNDAIASKKGIAKGGVMTPHEVHWLLRPTGQPRLDSQDRPAGRSTCFLNAS